VLGKEYRGMSTPGNRPSVHDDQEEPYLSPPGEGFELYRYKNAEKMGTKNWHGYYWARRTAEGDYEIRTVPTMLGEHSVPGGIMPKEGFEEHYETVSLQRA
jgi:hypothetical protein